MTKMTYDEMAAQLAAVVAERDAARNAIAAIYKSVTGENPEWSNWTAYLDDIVEEMGTAVREIEARGVEKFADKCMKKSQGVIDRDISNNWRLCSEHASDYAEELREASNDD